MGHYSTECKKAKSTKGICKALITKKTDLANTSDSDEEANYALMANADNDSVPSTD